MQIMKMLRSKLCYGQSMRTIGDNFHSGYRYYYLNKLGLMILQLKTRRLLRGGARGGLGGYSPPVGGI